MRKTFQMIWNLVPFVMGAVFFNTLYPSQLEHEILINSDSPWTLSCSRKLGFKYKPMWSIKGSGQHREIIPVQENLFRCSFALVKSSAKQSKVTLIEHRMVYGELGVPVQRGRRTLYSSQIQSQGIKLHFGRY